MGRLCRFSIKPDRQTGLALLQHHRQTTKLRRIEAERHFAIAASGRRNIAGKVIHPTIMPCQIELAFNRQLHRNRFAQRGIG